jgi:GT2 family glycosyltransferase
VKLATIIVTYNGAAYIEKCLQSVRGYTATERQIFVIDNGSTDATVQLIEEKFPAVVLVKSATNLGFGQANNKGIRLAIDWGADYFFLLNQDAYVVNDAMSKLVEIAIRNPDFGIISPVHLNGDRSAFDHGFIQHIARQGESNEMLFDLFQGKPKEIYPVSFVNAAAWLLSKSCIEKVGGFAPLFFHYGEDDDYVHRAQYHGVKVGVCPGVDVVHDRKSKPLPPHNMPFLERMYVINTSDINRPYEVVHRQFISQYWVEVVKRLIRFKWRVSLGYFKLILRVKRLREAIQLHRHSVAENSLNRFIQ